MNRHEPNNTEEKPDELTPNDRHDGVARTGEAEPDAPMGSHFGAVATEVSPVTPAGSNVGGDELSGVASEVDPHEEHPGG